jgi:hypothetical protein
MTRVGPWSPEHRSALLRVAAPDGVHLAGRAIVHSDVRCSLTVDERAS